jgi:hypothetical protein
VEEVIVPAEEIVEPASEEARHTKGMRGPSKPTKQEKEDHERDHIPFRSWCAHCVRGKSKSSGHFSAGTDAQRSKPIVSLDYAFLGIRKGKNKEEVAQFEEEATRAGHTPQLVMFDSESKSTYAYVARQKGADEHLCKRVVEDLDNLGYKEILLKGDQEPALRTLIEMVKASWNGDAALENSPVGESESNGAVERAIQSWEGQVRTMKDALESRIKSDIPADHPIMTWLVEYAATLQRRCLVGSDGRTPQEKVKGRPSRRPVAEFAEKVWYRPLRDRRSKLDMVMEEGIYVGIIDRSDEALIAVENGIVKCRDIRRQLEECRWDKERVMQVKATPMAAIEGAEDMRVKTPISNLGFLTLVSLDRWKKLPPSLGGDASF